jgi:hypothetical protein
MLTATRSAVAGVAAVAAVVGTASVTATADTEPIVLTNVQWRCTSPQDGTVVYVTIDRPSGPDAVHLDRGCSGSIEVHIVTNSHDGVKVHAGSHDLQITGDITCNGRYQDVHQDGIQVMGGEHVLIGSETRPRSMVINCPTGNNGGVFVNAGRSRWEIPKDIVVDHADILEGNAAVHIGGDSIDAGVRDSTLHQGTSLNSPLDCVRIDAAAVGAFDVDNECVP